MNYNYIKKKPKNHHRETIKKYNLLQYIDNTNTKEVNKQIIREHVAGESMGCLANKYNLTPSAVAMIISCYVNKVSRYCKKNGIDYKDQCSN